MPFTHSFDTVGWFARSAAMMDRVARSFDCPDATPPSRLLLPVDVWARAGADAIAAVAPKLAQLEALMGPATPILLSPDGLENWRETFRICQAFEVWNVHKDWVTAQTPDFGPGIKERFEIAAQIDRETFETADAQRAAIQSHIRQTITPDSVLVLPSSPGPAPLRTTPESALNEFRMRAFEMLCVAGLSGLPQLSMPAGFVDEGPIGLSIIGAKDQDRQLISIGMALEDRSET
jgi:amidase